MDKQNLMPQVAQPVSRITTGQLPSELAELSEEALSMVSNHEHSTSAVLASAWLDQGGCKCSYDGDDAE
jgi:bacteriocin leader peptide (microcyclamide/patellamide family)